MGEKLGCNFIFLCIWVNWIFHLFMLKSPFFPHCQYQIPHIKVEFWLCQFDTPMPILPCVHSNFVSSGTDWENSCSLLFIFRSIIATLGLFSSTCTPSNLPATLSGKGLWDNDWVCTESIDHFCENWHFRIISLYPWTWDISPYMTLWLTQYLSVKFYMEFRFIPRYFIVWYYYIVWY